MAGVEFCVVPSLVLLKIVLYLMPNPKTLNLLLTDGEPDGRKIIKIPGWTGCCLVFPRNKLKEMGNDEVGKIIRGSGVYFLFGRESEDNLTILTYIGKANNIFERLNYHNHDNKKDFWHTTVIFTSNDMGDNHHCLEAQCTTLARKAQRFGYIVKNIDNPEHQPYEFNTPFIKEFVDNINLILTTLGYSILQKIESKEQNDLNDPLFYCQRKNLKTNGTGRMTNEGFVLYEGSVITSKHSPAVAKRNNKKIEELLEEKIIKKDGDIYIFKKDYIFSRPSFPASLILGFAKDGWHAWKTQDGKILDEIYRPK